MKKTIICILLFITSQARAENELKPHMQSFYLTIEKLNQYIADKDVFVSSKNNDNIEKALADFNKKILEIKKNDSMNEDDLKFRFKLLSDGLNEAESTFKNGSKDYSYWVLKSSLNNCFACHTQKELPATSYNLMPTQSLSDYNKAEFLFLYRNYSEANKIYEQLLMSYPNKATSFEMAESSLSRLMFYQVRVLKNDDENLALLNRLITNEHLPIFLRNNILAWRKYLNVKKFRVFEDTKIKSAADLAKFIDTRNSIASHYKLYGQRYLIDLETSSFLFNLLASPQHKNIRPWVLYWLAFQEKDYRLNMFDQSTDYYLKECMQKYSNSKAARMCFDLYKDITIESYTGSRGVDVPANIVKEIDFYKKLIKSN